ncbi:hypothetical protein NDU88_005800 [Pleurodeles waltl]|uniref:Uncharacterized protein n=1 Tax=Pleurodeles waltl TaxID=8319 RepID=A0AAV7N178_PLEWA|nr:hypothetical protein NDU88_005800 [Pleurodeles waltl]
MRSELPGSASSERDLLFVYRALAPHEYRKMLTHKRGVWGGKLEQSCPGAPEKLPSSGSRFPPEDWRQRQH